MPRNLAQRGSLAGRPRRVRGDPRRTDFTERTMIKHLWLALGFGLAVFVGVAVALAGPGATWVQAAPEQLSAVGVASGLTVALAGLFWMGFVGLAAIEGPDMRWGRGGPDPLVEPVAA